MARNRAFWPAAPRPTVVSITALPPHPRLLWRPIRLRSCRSKGEMTMDIATAIKFAPTPRRLLAAGLATLTLALCPAAPALAQAQAQMTIAANAYGAVRKVEVEMNKSMIVDLPAGVAVVVVSQPNIAAAIMRSRTRAIIQGLEEGA